MENPDTIVRTENLPALVATAIVLLVLVMIAGAVVRAWGQRMLHKPGAASGLDLDRLRRLRDTGEITQGEYDRVCGSIAPVSEKKKPATDGTDLAALERMRDTGAISQEEFEKISGIIGQGAEEKKPPEPPAPPTGTDEPHEQG
jgi:hypothetical protein